MARARVTVTVRPDLIEAADRKAMEVDRSRSWVLERALEAWLRPDPAGDGSVVREASIAYLPGIGPSRRAQLESDLALSAEERVRSAEETARIAERRTGHPQRDRVIMFASLDDYLAWDRLERVRV